MKTILIVDSDTKYAEKSFKYLKKQATSRSFGLVCCDGTEIPSEIQQVCYDNIKLILIHNHYQIFGELKERMSQYPDILTLRYTGNGNIGESMSAEKWYKFALSDVSPLREDHAQQLLDYLENNIEQPRFIQ